MSKDELVWVVCSESAESRIRSELAGVQGINLVGFRDVCNAINTLRKGAQKPEIILCNYHAADIVLEVANQKSRYTGVRTAYVSDADLSHLVASHNAAYVRLGAVNIDGLARLVNPH